MSYLFPIDNVVVVLLCFGYGVRLLSVLWHGWAACRASGL